MENNNLWGIAQVWNNSLLEKKERKLEARDRIWASELGKSPVDIYLKMKGIKETNPPNPRSMRKFEAGNIWEWLVGLILKRAGILIDKQNWSSFQYPNLLPVTGRLDYLAGGKPDYEKAIGGLKELELPEIFFRAGERITKYLQEKYPEGLDTKVIEVKSCSSFMFDSIEKNNSPSSNHKLQLFHYLKSENIPSGIIMYICKDDCRMIEIPILNPSVVEDEYRSEIEKITKYYKADEMPPLESPIVYDEEFKKFSKNWRVAYSSYLTKLYGFKDQASFDDNFSSIVERWNRVIGRVREGKTMTKLNEEILAEIKKEGFDLDKIIK